MKILKTINAHKNEPTDYTGRLTVKAIVMDDNGNTAVFSGLPLGGGVEDGETLEEALHRECMKEAGIVIEITKPLGTVIQYRDELKRKYEVHGFLARLVEGHGLPTTEQGDELEKIVEWVSVNKARNMFEKRISELEVIKEGNTTKDTPRGRLYNTVTALTFLNEATK